MSLAKILKWNLTMKRTLRMIPWALVILLRQVSIGGIKVLLTKSRTREGADLAGRLARQLSLKLLKKSSMANSGDFQNSSLSLALIPQAMAATEELRIGLTVT